MRDDLAGKLKKIFLQDKLDEKDVVYVLVQINKYIERVKTDGGDSYSAPCLKFFRNWVVHGQLENQQPYLNTLNQFIETHSENQLYEKMFGDLINEVNNQSFVNIPVPALESFRDSLFQVIKDVPANILSLKKKIIATDNRKIAISEIV